MAFLLRWNNALYKNFTLTRKGRRRESYLIEDWGILYRREILDFGRYVAIFVAAFKTQGGLRETMFHLSVWQRWKTDLKPSIIREENRI